MRTIAAIATPLIKCPIHIIRVSGPDTFKIINKLVDKNIEPEPYKIKQRRIMDKDIVIDDVLICIFCKPKSYTGEDTIEINCHGNPLVTKKILDLLVLNGCEHAKPGEFSMQALINNKMNYSKIEATNNLINASNNVAAKYAINSILGKDTKKLEKIKQQIFEITGSIEVNIDYPEYDDVPQLNHQDIIKKIKPLIKQLETIYKNSKIMLPIFNGVKVGIIGRPNVGKSSLLNVLSKQEKAIVSNVSGTTRDIVESEILFEGINFKLLDTAGIRKTKDKIETAGINKSLNIIKEADLILWLTNVNEKDQDFIDLLKGKEFIKVYNKSDKFGKKEKAINICTKNGEIKELIKAIKKYISKIDLSNNDQLVLQSDRQISLLEKIIKILNDLINDLKDNQPLDLLQSSFEQIIILLNGILGNNFEFDKIDEMFKHFCLGK